MSARSHTQELDGIRAFAVWMVMFYHAGAPLFAGGWIGVDIFFVLSGFLITTLLVREHETKGRVSLRNFWTRRSLRLLPAYFFYLFFATLLFVAAPPPPGHVLAGWTGQEYFVSLWLYFANLAPRGGIWEYQSIVTHLWSLAIEQQFYLALCIMYVIAVWSRISLGTVLALSLVVCAALSHAGLAPGTQAVSLFGRGNSLFVGCLIAIWAPKIDSYFEASKTRNLLKPFHIFCILGTIALVITALLRAQLGQLAEFTAITLFDGALYIALGLSCAGYWYGWSNFGSKLLSNSALVYIGAISYGIYIYHMFAREITFTFLADYLEPATSRYINYGLKMCVYLALAHLMAAVSYKYIERPFLNLKRKAPAQPDEAKRAP